MKRAPSREHRPPAAASSDCKKSGPGGEISRENAPYKLPCLPIFSKAESRVIRPVARKVTFCGESVRRTLRCRTGRPACSSPFRGSNPRCFDKIRFSRPDRSLRCRSRPSAGQVRPQSAGPASRSGHRTRRPRTSTGQAFSGASTRVSLVIGGCRNSPARPRQNPCRPEGSRSPPDRSVAPNRTGTPDTSKVQKGQALRPVFSWA